MSASTWPGALGARALFRWPGYFGDPCREALDNRRGGESGSGKTIFARLLLGLAEPSDGGIRYRGNDLRKLDRDGRRAFRHDIQAVFQDPYGVYNRFYRVDHVLATPLRRFRLAGSRAEARQVISEAPRAVVLSRKRS